MAQQQASSADNSMAIAWIIAFIFIVGGLTWYIAHAEIVKFIFKVKIIEAEMVALIYDHMEAYAKVLRELDPAQVSFNQLGEISASVGRYIRYPVIVIFLVMAAYLYQSSVAEKYSKKYDMRALAKAEAVNWPQITPILGVDLVKIDIMEGPWSMALNPMEFAKKHELLDIVEQRDEHDRRLPPIVTVRKDKARDVFVEQLGSYWEGVDQLKPYAQALFAVFAARINRDRDGAMKMIRQLAQSSALPSLDYTGVKELLAKYANTPIVQKIINKHAYELTVMAAMLKAARDDGVVASADFLWLKPVDRRLWYMLNTVGRQTPFVEVAGPFAHWIAERAYGNKIRSPMVDTAVKGLEIAMSEVLFKPDKEED